MTKKVRYNGGTESYYGSSDPSKLSVGKVYEVISSNVRKWQTDYVLKGVEGEFNSAWFEEVTSNQKGVYIALANKIPETGERYKCYKIEFINKHPNFIEVYTSVIKKINYMGNNIYQVTTQNSVYIVEVA